MNMQTKESHSDLERFFALGESDPTADLELRNSVASRLLAPIQNRLPQCLVSCGGELQLTRAELPRSPQSVIPLPRHLFMINWADSGPGISWPEDYYVTFVPGFERFVVTASMDGTDMWGVTDLTIGSFAGSVDLRAGVESVIVAWWSAQNREEPWAYVWGTGLIDKETAERWCEAVWPEQPIEEDWE